MDPAFAHRTASGLDDRSADFLIRQALMHRARNELPEALRALTTLLEHDPAHAEAIALKDSIEKERRQQEHEQKEAERARGRRYAGICRALSILLLIGAMLFWDAAMGNGRQAPTAGPIVFGMRRVYWYLLGVALMAVLSFVVWLQRYRWIPDWTDLDQPDPKGVYGYRWWW
ncbi:MAG: hypothetical protein GX446_18435 [Chthonomonadales bacterium]|nr:hypothetical protein [Chthonomonadales bacterium]